MKISVIGTGYVGLVTGTCFAESGNDVLCIDNNPEKLEMLNSGQVPIYEPGLENLFKRNTKEERLKFSGTLKDGVEHGEIIFLALPTPPQEDGSADLKYVLQVAEQIAELMTDYRIIVTKSTVPVGTADKIRAKMSSKTDVKFDVVSNPEFLREGVAVQDFMKPDRVVVGTSSEHARERMEHLFRPFVRQGNPIYFMDERSSEMTKYAANAFLATKISFMNEVANICEAVGANVDDVRIGIGSDTRIGKRFLFPGVGYGGSCFPKDVQALHFTAKAHDYPFKILEAVMSVNEAQKARMFEKLAVFFADGGLKGKRIAVWGLAFKPETDDIREAPALVLIQRLLAVGAKVSAFDPVAIPSVQKLHPELEVDFKDDKYDATEGADALLIVTEWNEFRTPNLEKLKSKMAAPIIFDGRNVFELEELEKAGFYYNSIGRTVVDGRQ